MSPNFFQRRFEAPDVSTAERWLAEAFAAGAAGSEEREAGTAYLLYLPAEAVAPVEAALRAAGAPPARAEPVPEKDWSEAWREGLAPIEISPRLRIRPPFAASVAREGLAEVVIEPGQAFGTGGHESTRLALELLDAWLAERAAGARVLDVGAGSGVLAIAAVKLGAAAAVGFDLDPLSAEAARENARDNGVAERATFFTGGIEALAPGGFDGVAANLLWSEVAPIVPAIAERLAPGGVALFAGLLARDRAPMERALGASGLTVREVRERADADGEVWIGLAAQRVGG